MTLFFGFLANFFVADGTSVFTPFEGTNLELLVIFFTPSIVAAEKVSKVLIRGTFKYEFMHHYKS